MFLTQSVIVGGAPLDSVLGNPPRDIDLFFKSKEVLHKVISYITQNTKTPYDQELIEPRLLGYKINSTRESLLGKMPVKPTPNSLQVGKVQIVTLITGTTEYIQSKMDFNVCTLAYELSSNKLITNKGMELSNYEAGNNLVYQGSDYPVSSLLRVSKYANNGYKVAPSTLASILVDIANLGQLTSTQLLDQLSSISESVIDQLAEEANPQVPHTAIEKLCN